jgi:hypothetical protein
MKKEIELTSEQEREVIGLYEDMNKEAIELGNRFRLKNIINYGATHLKTLV